MARYQDGRPAAGVLATNGLWWRYRSTASNANRKRANQASRILLCQDYLVRGRMRSSWAIRFFLRHQGEEFFRQRRAACGPSSLAGNTDTRLPSHVHRRWHDGVRWGIDWQAHLAGHKRCARSQAQA